MKLLAIDPGSEDSAVVVLDRSCRALIAARHLPNDRALVILQDGAACVSSGEEWLVLCEDITDLAHVDKQTKRTIEWIGRFELRSEQLGLRFERLSRPQVVSTLCPDFKKGNKDAAVRQAVLNRLGPQGTKAKPGLSYGLSGHLWQAAGLAFAWIELQAKPIESWDEWQRRGFPQIPLDLFARLQKERA